MSKESVSDMAERLISDRLGAVAPDSVLKARKGMRLLRAYDAQFVSCCESVDCGEESVVQQQFKDECDINTIVRRFGFDQIPPARPGGLYGDFTGITDFHSALERLEAARDGFMSLAPEVRERFNNDPGELLEQLQDLDDESLRAELGLMAPAEPAAAPAAPVEPSTMAAPE